MVELEFDSKLVLVSGASKGIGLACARAFLGAGARVAGVARTAQTLALARDALARDGLSMHIESADLVDAHAAAALLERLEQRLGPVDVLVSAAGAARRYGPDELDAQALRQAMDAKYFATMHLVQPVIARMAARGRGSVVAIVGQGGRQANTMHIAGGAANAALMLAVVGLARAHAARGVRINAINPGLTRTSRVEEGIQAEARATGRGSGELLEAAIARIPMGRMAEPDEIAQVALFLASPRASYVSGAIIPMDGCATSVI